MALLLVGDQLHRRSRCARLLLGHSFLGRRRARRTSRSAQPERPGQGVRVVETQRLISPSRRLLPSWQASAYMPTTCETSAIYCESAQRKRPVRHVRSVRDDRCPSEQTRTLSTRGG